MPETGESLNSAKPERSQSRGQARAEAGRAGAALCQQAGDERGEMGQCQHVGGIREAAVGVGVYL